MCKQLNGTIYKQSKRDAISYSKNAGKVLLNASVPKILYSELYTVHSNWKLLFAGFFNDKLASRQ